MQNDQNPESGKEAKQEEDDRLTNTTTTVRQIPTGVEMAASPKHVQPCVHCGGWGGGWVMSQAHMLASVPDLLVFPVRHVTQQGAARAAVCCARKPDDDNMSKKCRSHSADVR